MRFMAKLWRDRGPCRAGPPLTPASLWNCWFGRQPVQAGLQLVHLCLLGLDCCKLGWGDKGMNGLRSGKVGKGRRAEEGPSGRVTD